MRVKVTDRKTIVMPFDSEHNQIVTVEHPVRAEDNFSRKAQPAEVCWGTFSPCTPDEAAQYGAALIYAAGIAAYMNESVEGKSEVVPA